jgi:hypothetical protein
MIGVFKNRIVPPGSSPAAHTDGQRSSDGQPKQQHPHTKWSSALA